MRLPSTAVSATRGVVIRDRSQAWLHRLALALRLTRARLPLAVALSLAFGLMLVATLAGVLVLAFYAGATNTRDLLADRTNLLLDTLDSEVERLLQPAADQLEALAGELATTEISPEGFMRGHSTLRAMMAATPQVAGYAVLIPEMRAFRHRRGVGPMPPQDWSEIPEIRAIVASARPGDPVQWGPPVYSEAMKQTIINAHLPVYRDGRLVGVLFAAVTLETVVRFVDQLSQSIGQPVFVLQGEDHVVARPGLDTSATGPMNPLPLLAEAGDPVLAALWAGEQKPLGLLGNRLRGEGRMVTTPEQQVVVLYRRIPGFGDRPWIVGTYLPANVAGLEIQRLRHALLLSLGCVLVAVTATFWLGRRMARPVAELAEAAQHIQTLELDQVPVLPRSGIVELDRAARAFNAMRNGLAWFETYVPRRLVRQLMTNPSPDAVVSRQLEVTVLFTDIVGFSSLVEELDAGTAAAMLNEHFELLAACVAETEGTVDKFLGDGMMAFWGAPVPQEDHASRAVQAASMIRERLRAAEAPVRLRLRIGIHTGTALVGNIGSRDRLNYTLVGDTVNVAHRLEQLGKEIGPGADVLILASADTAAQASAFFTCFRSLGQHRLRGRDEVVEVFRLAD